MDILEQAIADAKSIREAAVSNAKASLAETFRPTLQRMISSRLEEEGDEEDIEMASDVAPVAPAPVAPEVPAEEAPVEDVPQAPMAPPEDTPSQDDLDLEELLAELDALDQEGGAPTEPEEPMMEGDFEDEDEISETIRKDGFGPDDSGGAYDSSAGLKHTNLKTKTLTTKKLSETDDADADDEEVDLDELFSENYEKTAPAGSKNTKAGVSENRKLKAELNKAYKAISVMKAAINETQLLNAKLLYATKISRNFTLSDNQKTKILEAFDRAANPRECQLMYAALAQSLSESKVKAAAPARKPVMESVTRKGLGNSKPDEFSQRARWEVLSGIKKITE